MMTNPIAWLIVITFALMFAVIDFSKRIIPNKLLLLFLAVSGVLLLVNCTTDFNFTGSYLLSAALGLLITGGIFLAMYILSKGALGAGDVKLMAVIGFTLRLRSALYITLFSMGIFALVSTALLLTKMKTPKDTLPLAPFIFVAVLICAALELP
jgi:Flp pilus assembly protein protease CpaA